MRADTDWSSGRRIGQETQQTSRLFHSFLLDVKAIFAGSVGPEDLRREVSNGFACPGRRGRGRQLLRRICPGPSSAEIQC
jgi:hypothetical protein